MAIIKSKPLNESHASAQAEVLILTYNETAKPYRCEEVSAKIIERLVWKAFHMGACHQRVMDKQLEQIAREQLQHPAVFTDKINRDELFGYYSAADLFAFPGIEESLGMVYLEAQSCGLPVIAHRDWGGGEAIMDKQTGLLSSSSHPEEFTENMEVLITKDELRRKLGQQGIEHVKKNHDIDKNYDLLNTKISSFTGPLDPE